MTSRARRRATPREVATRVLAWYAEHARPLPWRDGATPYEVLVSEVMLQQTQVATVLRYFRRFLDRFPDVRSLAEASDDELLGLWAGLGYYRRALNLRAAAQAIVRHFNGTIPRDLAALRALPGLGDYTARAVLLFAFDLPEVPIDANLERVLARLLGEDRPIKSREARARLEGFVRELFRFGPPQTLVHALMDHGALICTARSPRCDACSLRPLCAAAREGRVHELPVKNGRTQVQHEHEWRTVLLDKAGRTLIWRRQQHRRWGGLWEFLRVDARDNGPDSGGAEDAVVAALQEKGLCARFLLAGKPIRYQVTRFRITAVPWLGKWISGHPIGLPDDEHTEAAWVEVATINRWPMSTPQRRIANWLGRVLPTIEATSP